MKKIFSAMLALCVIAALAVPAFAADYTIDAPDGPDYAKPTSVDYVYTADGGAQPNENLSKDAALIPPGFGVGGIYPLNAVSAPVTVNSANAVIGGGAVVYPGSVAAPTTQATTSFTEVTSDLKYANGSLGTLKIPTLGLSVSIYNGTDSATLAKGVGHFTDTSIWNGNVCLAAHNRGTNNYFGQIHTLSIGDKVTLTTKLGTRTYAVTSVSKISETDGSGLAVSGENMITLYTCVRDERDFRWCVTAVETV